MKLIFVLCFFAVMASACSQKGGDDKWLLFYKSTVGGKSFQYYYDKTSVAKEGQKASLFVKSVSENGNSYDTMSFVVVDKFTKQIKVKNTDNITPENRKKIIESQIAEKAQIQAKLLEKAQKNEKDPTERMLNEFSYSVLGSPGYEGEMSSGLIKPDSCAASLLSAIEL